MGRFEITFTENHQYQFVLKANNGFAILYSNIFADKQTCYTSINAVKMHAQQLNNFIKKATTNENYYFFLNSNDAELIGKSELYKSESARDNAIYFVKINTKEATIEDYTTITEKLWYSA
jgi:hypothetical protein